MHEQRLRRHGPLDNPERTAHSKGVPLSTETKAKLSAALKGRKAHNRVEFTEQQVQLITSYTVKIDTLAEKYSVSRNIIKRIRRENKHTN
jgi:hypothetical protein